MSDTKEKVEQKLQDISKLRKKIDEKDSALTQKIVSLETKRANTINPMSEELVELEKDLQVMVNKLEFTKDSKMVKFPIGRVFVKKQPDKIIVDNVDATVKKAEDKGYKEAVKITKTLNHTVLKTYNEKKLKSIGVSIETGKDKSYYQLDWMKSSTGLVF